jgi:hypothetical protein
MPKVRGASRFGVSRRSINPAEVTNLLGWRRFVAYAGLSPASVPNRPMQWRSVAIAGLFMPDRIQPMH